MKLTQSNIIRAALFMVLLVCGLMQLKISLFEQSKFSRPRPHSTLWRQQISPEYLTAAAHDLSLSQGRSDRVLRLLQRSLTLNPLYIPAWITLSELEVSQGKSSAARKILTYIDGLMVDVSRWRWQKTMLAYQLGEREILARDLDYAVAELPQHRQQALDLAASLWPDAETRLEKIGAHNLLHLFRFSLHPERLQQALIYWPGVRGSQELELRYKLRFIELLRQQGDFRHACGIWQEVLPTDSILYNGNFTTPPLQTAFGWRIGKVAGSSWKLSAKAKNENSAFHLHFTGSENVNYHHLIQYFIPVTNKPVASSDTAYTLTGEVSCEGLTTDQRPYFEVVGVNTRQLRARTPMFATAQTATRFSLKFIVPPGCQQVYVRLRRNKSNDINCRIAGNIWISNLKITADGLIND